MSGRMTRADRLDVAYFAQHQLDELNPDGSAYDHVRRLMPDAPEAKVRARAGAIGFSAEAADTPSANLSGGEKARLLLGLATNCGPHLVVLDEPTNHLDIDSRAALIDAINDYPGAVILVSHDRYLIEACADRLWLVADGQVTPFDGDLDDYRRLVLADRRDDKERERQPKGASRGDARRAAAQLRVELAPLAAPDRRCGRRGRATERRDRAHRRGAGGRRTVRARSRQGGAAFQGSRANAVERAARAPRTTGSPPARRLKHAMRVNDATSVRRRDQERAAFFALAFGAALAPGASGARSIDTSRPAANR